MKLSTFKAQTHINPALVDAVVNQLGGKESFKESAPDITSHGIDGGFHGFIYYTDTIKFAKDNIKPIISLCEELAGELGGSGALELIAGFNCLNGDYSQTEIAEAIYGESEDTQVLNALAWFAAEEVARSYTDMSDQ